MSNLEKRRRIIETLPTVMREAFNEIGLKRDVCVLASNVGRVVLKHYGISAKPVAVKVIAMNAVVWDYIDGDLDRLAAMEEGEDERVRDLGGHSVWVGFGKPQPGRWAGHLVLTTRNPDYLLDLTMDQASRPEKGLPLEPLAMPTDRVAVKALERGVPLTLQDDDTGVRAVYAHLEGLDYRAGTDWNGASAADRRFVDTTRKRLAEEIITGIEMALARMGPLTPPTR